MENLAVDLPGGFAGNARSGDASSDRLGVRVALDSVQRRALLFPSEWTCDYFVQKNPTIPISALPFRENSDSAAKQ